MDESTATTSPSTNEIEDSLEAMQDLFIFSAHESEFCCLLLKTETFYTSSPSLISRVCCLMSKPQALDVKKARTPGSGLKTLNKALKRIFPQKIIKKVKNFQIHLSQSFFSFYQNFRKLEQVRVIDSQL